MAQSSLSRAFGNEVQEQLTGQASQFNDRLKSISSQVTEVGNNVNLVMTKGLPSVQKTIHDDQILASEAIQHLLSKASDAIQGKLEKNIINAESTMNILCKFDNYYVALDLGEGYNLQVEGF